MYNESIELVIQNLEKKWVEIKTEKEEFIKNSEIDNSVRLSLAISNFDKRMENVLREIVIVDEVIDKNKKDKIKNFSLSMEEGIPIDKMFMVNAF